jgi:RHS repeat-associated protein
MPDSQRSTPTPWSAGPWLSAIARRFLALLAVAVVGVFASSVSAAASGLPEVEVAHMSEIVEWAYRGAAVAHPTDPCGSVCQSLWASEQGSFPETAATQEFWDELAAFYTEKTHLWGSMTEFRDALGGAFNLGAPPFRVGWHIGSGEGSKWMEVIGPTAPSVSIGCGWRGIFHTGGDQIGGSFHEQPTSPGNEWYLIGCNNSEIVAEYAYGENPLEPERKCNKNSFNFTVEGWTRQEWWWNDCGEGFYNGKELYAPIIAEGFYKNFHFGRVVDWTGQKLEGEYTRNIQTVGPSDPGLAAVREAIEKALEESPGLRSWLGWALEGENGANPLGTVPSEEFGGRNPSAPSKKGCFIGHPVNCATGDQVETQTDLTVGGRGPGLNVTRSYDEQLAAGQSAPGPFGYGWSGPYSDRVQLSEEQKRATVYQDNGSTVGFTRSGEQWVPANPLVLARLVSVETGFTYTLPDQTVLAFNPSGQLLSETDRNQNTVTVNHDAQGRVESAVDPAGRKITLAYNAQGLVETATDPMGHVVKYAYEGGNLVSVTLPGEIAADWQFKYDSQHRLTGMTDGRGGKVSTEYDGSNRVVSQTDAMERTLSFQYEPSRTKVTNKATGAVTDEHFGADGQLVSITHAYGTASATTTKYAYDKDGNPASVTDGNQHTTTYEYDSAGDRVKMASPEGHETKWTYDGTHDVLSMTTPRGETTTIKRDSHGNAESVSRPAPGETTQTTKYTYDAHGELESMTDPLGRKWTYEYDGQGDRVSETDPEGDKRTWAYDEDSQETSTVSPRGNVTGGEPAKYTTAIERDAQGRPVKITDPLGHATKYAYDTDGNPVTEVDPNGHETNTVYDADNEPVKVTMANGAVRETGYDGAGQVTSQSDGNNHTTSYKRNVLEQVVEVVDPLLHKTVKTYDLAGNPASVIDPANRTSTYTYDKDDRLTKIAYSDGVTPTVEYAYDADGQRTSMTDGTGTTVYTYDQLDRLIGTKDGHGNLVKYEYDLAGEQTKITYPNTKTIERAYDKAGRLTSVKDWLGNTTSFGYDPDSNQTSTVFPAATGETDSYSYNQAGQQSEVKMSKGTETLASLSYTRDSNGQVTKTLSKGLPGAETTEYAYDPNERLTKAGTTLYEYDLADNPLKNGTITNTFNAADELTEATGATYGYDQLGERTTSTPTGKATTTYGYDQAGDLTSATRPAEGTNPEIKDTYISNGDGLRVAQKTTFLTWDLAERLPLMINDGTHSYLYGPANIPFGQITGDGKTTYLHHDQQGSTRLITNPTGTTEGAYTYDPYGHQTNHTGTATTPLDYNGQYTNSNTGLIYLRARNYDPATAQFLSVDPAEPVTGAPYTYTYDDPVNARDLSGLFPWGAIAEGVAVGGACLLGPEVCAPAVVAVLDYHVVKADVNSVATGCSPWSSIVPSAVSAGVSFVPFGGGVVAKDVWESSRLAYRIGATTGNVTGDIGGGVASSNGTASCGC